MKKNVLYIVAVIAITMVGCKKQEPNSDDEKIVVEDTYKFLGRGYDATAHYAMEADVKAPVLSQTLLDEAGYVDKVQTPLVMISYNTFGKNLKEYEDKVSQTLKIGGEGWGFKGSLSDSFTDDAISTEENSFYTSRYSKEMKSYKILSNATTDKLVSCLNSTFKNDISSGKYTAEQIVDMYGTHVIAGFSMGGRLEFCISAMNETNLDEHTFKMMADLGYKNTVGEISGSDEFEKYKKFKTESKNFTEKFYCRGGKSSEIKFEGDESAKKASYNEWDASLDDENNQVLVEFAKDRGLIPLYEFISDATLSAQVKEVVQNRLNEPISQSSGYRKFKLYFKRVDVKHYYDANGYLKWHLTMTVQPESEKEVCYLYNTETRNVNVPGGGLSNGCLYMDSGDCSSSGTYPGIDFKTGKTGAKNKDEQKEAVSKGEPSTKEFRLNRWTTNNVKIKITNLKQDNFLGGHDRLDDINLTVTCQPGSDTWTYYKGNELTEVFDRSNTNENTEIFLVGSSKKDNHVGEYAQFILEYEWQ